MNRVGIILAAGRGTRLAPLTDEVPKCLVLVNDVPILHHQLSALVSAGIEQVLIVVGYRADQIREYVKKHFSGLKVTFIENERYTETNTFYSLALAAETVPESATVVQLNGDVVFNPGLITALLAEDASKSLISVQPAACGAEEVKAVLDRDGRVTELSKIVDSAAAVGEAVGINRFGHRFWNALRSELLANREENEIEYYEKGIEGALKSNTDLFSFNIADFEAVEVDFHEDLLRARALCFLK